MQPDTVYIDIKTCGLTIGELMDAMRTLIAEHPDEDIHLDGDLYAIAGRRKARTN